MNDDAEKMDVYPLDVHAMSKSELSEVRKMLCFVTQPTVAQLRGMLRMGMVSGALCTLGTALLLLMLGVLFMPLLLAIPVVLVLVPVWVRARNKRWDVLLPAERDAATVIVTGVVR